MSGKTFDGIDFLCLLMELIDEVYYQDYDEQTMLDCVGEGNWLTGEFVAAGLEDGTVKSYYENQQKVFIDAGRITEEVPVENYVMFDVMEEAVAANYGA